jgi:very-short-patch-repair endonuclease
MGPISPSRSVDAIIVALARLQHGAVARAQLHRRGISDHAIKTRLRDGRLTQVHRGVYLVGPAVDPLAMEAAAVLACAGRAVISHRSAAKLHKLFPYPAQADVWVTLTSGDHRRNSGLVVRRRSTLRPVDMTRHEGIPVTTAARTILDLAGILDEERLERACAEAHALKLAKEPDLREQLERNAGRRGVGRLRRLLDRPLAPARTRSPLERELLRLIRASDLPQPESDQWVGPYLVDFLWREQRVVVETDGLAFHTHHRARRSDRARTNGLQLRGYTVLRFTWVDVTKRPDWTLSQIREALTPSP